MPLYVDPLPVAPNTVTRTDTLDPDCDGFFGALPTFRDQLNALPSVLADAASPSSITIPYIFDGGGVSDVDPGGGKVRLDNATHASATVIRADLLDAVGIDATGQLARIGVGTSAVKGYLRLVKVGDARKWIIWDVAAMASPAGYRNIAVSNGVASTPNPFADGDALLLTYSRSGDKGDIGPTGPTAVWNLLATNNVSGTPTTVTMSSISPNYGDLLIVLDRINFASAGILCIGVSPDGTTWSAQQPLQASSFANYTGTIYIPDYRHDVGVITPAFTSALIPAGPNIGFVAHDTRGLVRRCPGGITAIRFSEQAGITFTDSVIKIYGR